MQLSNIPGKLVLPFANAGGKSTIPVASQIGITAGAASLTDGFPPLTRTPVAAGGVPPSGLDMNGILYEMSAIIRWANAGGGYPYDGTFATDTNVGGYPKGARVMRSDGTGYWFNTVENNVTDPEGAGAAAAGWVPDYQSGVAPVAMSGSSVTLTPNQYGKPLIVITGTLSANLNLIFPPLAQGWTVINNATGGYSITAKTASGSGVTLGTISQIVGDGTNMYAANPDSVQIVNNVATLRNIAPRLSRRIQTRGYYADGDGGSAQYFPKVGAAPGTYVHNGGTVIVPNGGDGSAAWLLDITNGISVKRFGAVGDGVTDDTAAIQAAYDYLRATSRYFTLNFPAGKYRTNSQFVFEDAYFCTLNMEGCCFVGASPSSTYDSVFKINNAEGLNITGSWTVTASLNDVGDGNNVNLYESGFRLDASPGGIIEPTNGICAFVDIYGLTAARVACGVSIGTYNNDAQIAEINFHGYKALFVPKSVKLGGSQTVATFNGCRLTSNPVAFLTSPDYKVIDISGGLIHIVGGEVTHHANTTGPVIDFKPASSALYRNPYPQVYITGVLIESKATLARLHNPLALTTPVSYLSKLSFVNCAGYTGDIPDAASVISVDDASYAGVVSVDESCNFYRNYGSSTRAGATVNCTTAPNTRVSVGKTSFDKSTGYPSWMAGVSGGQLIHSEELGIIAYANSGTKLAGDNIVVFNQNTIGGDFARYGSMLNTTTGVITMPASNPPRSMKIDCSFLTGAVTGDVYIQDITNSRTVAFGQIVGGVARVSGTLYPLAGNQQFAIKANTSGDITFGGSITNSISIYVSN